MKSRLRKRGWFWIFVFGVSLLGVSEFAGAEDFVVIVNSGVSESALKKGDRKNRFPNNKAKEGIYRVHTERQYFKTWD